MATQPFSRTADAATKTPLRASRVLRAGELEPLDVDEPLVDRRRLELAGGTHLRGRCEHALLALRQLAQIGGTG